MEAFINEVRLRRIGNGFEVYVGFNDANVAPEFYISDSFPKIKKRLKAAFDEISADLKKDKANANRSK